MTNLYIIILITAVTVVAGLQILLLLKKSGIDLTPVVQGLQTVEASQERMGRFVRDEIGKNREESTSAARDSRVELSGNLKAVSTMSRSDQREDIFLDDVDRQDFLKTLICALKPVGRGIAVAGRTGCWGLPGAALVLDHRPSSWMRVDRQYNLRKLLTFKGRFKNHRELRLMPLQSEISNSSANQNERTVAFRPVGVASVILAALRHYLGLALRHVEKRLRPTFW